MMDEGDSNGAFAELDELMDEGETTPAPAKKERKTASRKPLSRLGKIKKSLEKRGSGVSKLIVSTKHTAEVSVSAQIRESEAISTKLENIKRVHKEAQPFFRLYVKGIKRNARVEGLSEEGQKRLDSLEPAIEELAVLVNKLLDAQKKRDKDGMQFVKKLEQLQKKVDESVTNMLEDMNKQPDATPKQVAFTPSLLGLRNVDAAYNEEDNTGGTEVVPVFASALTQKNNKNLAQQPRRASRNGSPAVNHSVVLSPYDNYWTAMHAQRDSHFEATRAAASNASRVPPTLKQAAAAARNTDALYKAAISDQ